MAYDGNIYSKYTIVNYNKYVIMSLIHPGHCPH